jgi:hypothetical protein
MHAAAQFDPSRWVEELNANLSGATPSHSALTHHYVAVPHKQSNALRQRAGVNKTKHARATIRDIDQPALHRRAAANQRNAKGA